MTVFLLAMSVIIILCLFLNRISDRLGIPALLGFILLGIAFGVDGIVKIPFDNYLIAEQICSISLIFIMFYGGFGTNWKQARPVAAKAILLSSAGVVLTALFTGMFCYFVLHFAFLESMLMGAVIGSTDAASVFSILRSKRLNLKYHTASLLELESGSNDPCSNILTVILLTLMSGQQSVNLAGMVLRQVFFGLLFGVFVALAAKLFLSRVRFSDGLDSVFLFSIALISYALAAFFGGNGYLSTYLTGILLGNSPVRNKKSMVHFFDGITGLMQMALFFLLGLLCTPSQMPAIFLPALAIVLFLTFVSRPLAAGLLMAPFRCPLKQILFVSWAGLRGASSIVFAIMVTISPAYTKNDIFHVAFFIVLFSILIQGSLIPAVARKLDMLDEDSDIMKTFTDYTEEAPIQFLELSVSENHPWAGKKVQELPMLPGILLALILRDGKQVVPRGQTVVEPGDRVILSGPAIGEESFGSLSERTVTDQSEWCGKKLSEIRMAPEQLVLLIRRGSQTVIPNGSTVLLAGDTLIINQP